MSKKDLKALKVAEAFQNDIGRGIARIDSEAKEALNVSTGDVIKLNAKKSALAIAWQSHPDDEGKGLIRIDGILRQNVNVGLGDSLTIEKVEVKEARKLILAPTERMRYSPGFDSYVKKRLIGKPLLKGNYVPVGIFGRAIPLIVAQAFPQGPVIVGEGTEVVIKEEPMKEIASLPTITYDDIGGLKDIIIKVREMVELPLRHPELFEKLGIDPPKGVLLYGPPGTGKTLLAKAVANESDANFFYIGGPEVVSKFVGESEERLRKIFKDAEENAPSIIFIDEIDSIAQKRGEVTGEVEKRLVSQLLTLMDGLKARGNVIVVAATNRPDSIDPALRRPGRFDREIELGVPSREGRDEILKIHTRNMPLGKNVDMKRIAAITHGYTGADIASLIREAAMKSLRRILPKINLEEEFIPPEILETIQVTKDDFLNALREIQPSALREVFIERPNVTWKDIGGLEKIKAEVQEAVELPLKRPEVFEKMGIRPVKGILLYGPPGTGKTLIAKAVANEAESNFIGISGTQILSKWVGESLSYDEEVVLFDENGNPFRVKIGKYVDSLISLNASSNYNQKQVSKVELKHKTFSFDKNGNVVFCPVTDVLRHPAVEDIYEVETRTGRKIRLTKDHGLFTLKGAEIAETKTSELLIGKSFVAIPKILKLPEKTVSTVSLAVLSKYPNYKIEGGKIWAVNSPKTKLPLKLELTTELGYIIGLWLAEGDYNNGIRIHNQNPWIREKLRECATKLEMPLYENEKFALISSRLWMKTFKEILGLKSGAYTKRFPAFTFALPKKVLTEILNGYFSGDGSIYGNSHRYYVDATTVSEKMADDLMTLLLYFGIVATKYTKSEKRYNHDKYVVQFSGVDNFRKFMEISFADAPRAEKISAYILSKKWNRTHQIPLTDDIREFLIRSGKSEWAKSSTVGIRILKQALETFDPDKKSSFWHLIENNIFWDQVVSIRKIPYTKEYTYDLSVKGTERFFASGFFVHNSEKLIRELFRKARMSAPCILFIDEIDSIAPTRGGEAGHHVMERVVDTLLTEMDGLKALKNVVVVAATNRPDILDNALLRAGRFDRIIEIPMPDEKERLEILKIHTKTVPLDKDVKLEEIAKKIEGYSGADIENLCRESAMVAIRADSNKVKQKFFLDAMKVLRPNVGEMSKKSVEKFKSTFGAMYG